MTTSNDALPIPVCCWCQAPVVLEGKAAWCSGSEICRARQRAHGLEVNEQWLFLPTPSQTEVLEATETNLFVHSNRGSGKSHVMRWFCHIMALLIPGFKYAILRTSFPELMKNHLVFLKDEMDSLGGEANGMQYNKTEHVCYYHNGSMGFYMQAETDEQVKNALGVEMYLVVFDEAPTFKWEHMQKIASSVRVPSRFVGLKPMKRYLGNPIGDSIDELWKYFIDKDVDPLSDPGYRPADWRAIKLRLEDNVHLDIETYRRDLAGLGLPEHIRKAWLDGERVDERAMFAFQATKDGKPYHVIPELPRWGSENKPILSVDGDGWHIPEWIKIYRAYDHGFRPDPAVCVWFAVVGNRIIVFKEKTWVGVIAADIAKDIVEESRGMRISMTYCDPKIDIHDGSDVVSIRDTMENNGVPMELSTNSRELFAAAIHSALGAEVEWGTGEGMRMVPRIQFLQAAGMGVPLCIKYIPLMKFSETHPMEMADHKHDHLPIACAYFLMSVIPTTKFSDAGPPKKWLQPKKSTRRILGSDNVRMSGLR